MMNIQKPLTLGTLTLGSLIIEHGFYLTVIGQVRQYFMTYAVQIGSVSGSCFNREKRCFAPGIGGVIVLID
jgi:hypothetical protein